MNHLYIPADEIRPGDTLPDVSRFAVASVGLYPARVEIAFTGTHGARVDCDRSDGHGYRHFRVERPA